ncbi:unnamed protein product, partial [Brassica oleracea]
MKDTTKKTVPTGSTSKREHITKKNETIANKENSAILSQANIVSTQSTINSATTYSQIPPISLSSRSMAQRLRYKRKRTTNSIEGELIMLSDITNQVPSGTTHTQQSYLTPTHDERTRANTRIHPTTTPTGTKTDDQVKGNPCASAKRLRKNDSFSSRYNLHTPPTSFPTSSIPLSDTTDVSPSVRTQTQQEVLTPTFESSKSRLTAKEKGKGKAVACGKKSKTVHAIETEGVGLHVDGYSSEENDESIYHDYEGAYEVEGEQHYDCSSEESDTESESNVNFDMFSKESDTVGPSKRKTSSKGKNKAVYIDEGDATHKCEHCGAIMWYGERINRKRYARKPKFSMCCGHGQVQLPLLKESPAILKRFLTEDDEMSRYFRENIRVINMVFSFTSLGGKVDRSVKKRIGPQMFQLQGENYHLMGSLKPPNGEPKFGQLYIVDTENEIVNRSGILGKYKKSTEKARKEELRKKVIHALMAMLDECNPYVHQFRSARDRFDTNPDQTFHMRIISSREKDGRTYDTPTASEVAALIPGDFNLDMDKRDIVLQEKQTGWLKRISEIHPAYLALQYPLIFTYGEDGFRLGIQKRETDATAKLKRKALSMRQWYAFRLQERENECHTLLHSRRLFQQFLVDGYTTIEANRLFYLRMNQKSLRSDSYDSIQQAENSGKTDMHEQGSRFVLPASFTGGARYMKNMYLDAMAICKYFGFPDYFITFTCNPKWPEITRHLQPRKLSAEDRPEILSRIFKIKLESLMTDLTDKQLLGKTSSGDKNEIKDFFNCSLKRCGRKLGNSFLRTFNINEDSNCIAQPLPDIINQNVLIMDELSYNREELKADHDRNFPKLTDEQRKIYDEITDAVFTKKGGVFFVYGFGGTGKTFLWKLLPAAIRMRGEICLNVASSGIASLLLPGGRTAHSRFGIPINPDEFSYCNLVPGTDQADMVKAASLIIWDEAPMMSKHCFESLDRSMADIIGKKDNRPFAGKVVVLGGDFRQVLPVIHGAGRPEIVLESLNSSYLWKHVQV